MADERKKKLFELGPMEQVMIVMAVMVFASAPSIPWSLTPGAGSLTAIPLFSPATMLLVFIAYFGYHVLKRQEAARDRQKALDKAAAKSKSSSSSSSSSSGGSSSRSALTSKDIRAGGMPSSSSSGGSKTGNPGPKQVSKSTKDDPSVNAFQGNYFMTMQGPGRPALVPFQAGLRPKAGEAAGTMWWDNVPEDAKELMAPPVTKEMASKLSKTKNPWAVEATKKDIELLKLEKAWREEEARFEKVGNILQTLLGLLLCLVDMRLGIVAIVFFLWRHYTIQHERENDNAKEEREKEKRDISKKLSEAKKGGASRNEIQELQQMMEDLM